MKLTGAEILYLAGLAVIFAGILIIIIAIIMLSVRSSGKGNVRGGGAIIIGPVPIIFGTDKKSLKTIVLLSLLLTILLLAVMVVNYWLLA
ncbi:MAG TPA: DUF131 domain-containing protein [Candidatus Bathyarchaeia archaeon]